MQSEAFVRSEPFVRGALLDWYRKVSHLAFAYAAGSLVEGLADVAEFDLTMVWHDEPPGLANRVPITLVDASPEPMSFERANFNLDRLLFRGQQIDVKHVALSEFGRWVDEVELGQGTSGYPMPVVAMHAFTRGVVLDDEDQLAEAFLTRVATVPDALVAVTAERAAVGRASYLEELRLCVDRDDGLQFHTLAVEALRDAFIVWLGQTLCRSSSSEVWRLVESVGWPTRGLGRARATQPRTTMPILGRRM